MSLAGIFSTITEAVQEGLTNKDNRVSKRLLDVSAQDYITKTFIEVIFPVVEELSSDPGVKKGVKDVRTTFTIGRDVTMLFHVPRGTVPMIYKRCTVIWELVKKYLHLSKSNGREDEASSVKLANPKAKPVFTTGTGWLVANTSDKNDSSTVISFGGTFSSSGPKMYTPPSVFKHNEIVLGKEEIKCQLAASGAALIGELSFLVAFGILRPAAFVSKYAGVKLDEGWTTFVNSFHTIICIHHISTIISNIANIIFQNKALERAYKNQASNTNYAQAVIDHTFSVMTAGIVVCEKVCEVIKILMFQFSGVVSPWAKIALSFASSCFGLWRVWRV